MQYLSGWRRIGAGLLEGVFKGSGLGTHWDQGGQTTPIIIDKGKWPGSCFYDQTWPAREMAICPDPQWWHSQVKFTIPGPMTIADGVKNKHYEDVEHLHRHLSILFSLTIPFLRVVVLKVPNIVMVMNMTIMLQMTTTMMKMIMIKTTPKMTVRMIMAGTSQRLWTERYWGLWHMGAITYRWTRVSCEYIFSHIYIYMFTRWYDDEMMTMKGGRASADALSGDCSSVWLFLPQSGLESAPMHYCTMQLSPCKVVN